jgi:hypothetical protein
MTAPQCKQFLIGLPEAGKTTFLAALWHVVTSNEVEGSLVLERLSGDKEYLNIIRDLWADVKPLERTKVSAEQLVSMLLKDQKRGFVTETILPDLSGESFNIQWEHRKMKKDHATLISEAIGGLLLIHPDKVIEETLIPDAIRIVDGMKNQTEHISETIDEGISERIDQTVWDPKKAPTQIKLVDLLQFITALNNKKPIKLAVVISAWDRIPSGTLPSDWIKKRLPLLWQYLMANSEAFSVAFYGVSAQGGNLGEAVELRKKHTPSERIRVIKDDQAESHDITAPIRWIMDNSR